MEVWTLLFPPTAAGALTVLLLFLPALLILCSSRAAPGPRLFWAAASQSCWLYVLLYAWVRQERYPWLAQGAPDALQQPLTLPLSDALGWWSFVVPWMVCLMYWVLCPRPRKAGD